MFSFNPIQDLKPELVFRKEFDVDACRKWISELTRLSKSSDKAISPPSKQKRKAPARDGKPAKRGRRHVSEKQSVEREVVVMEKSIEKNSRRKEKAVDILSASDSVPDKQAHVKRKQVASGTSLIEASNTDFASHTSDDEENPKEPEEKRYWRVVM